MDQSGTLQPPALVPPEPVGSVSPADAANRVPLPAEETRHLDAEVAEFIGDLTTLDPYGPDFKARVDAIVHLGANESAGRPAWRSGCSSGPPMR